MIDVGDNELGIDNGRNVIHNRYYSISRRKYWVEISYNNEGYAFIILRKSNRAGDYLAVVLPIHTAEKLLRENDNEAE